MPSARKIVEIEALRGIAIVAVILVHGYSLLVVRNHPFWNNFTQHYADFWWGVDLFFAVSGFVIARSVLPQTQSATSRNELVGIFLGFWIRRIWRLFPAAWLWIGASLALSVFFNRSHIFETFHHNYLNAVAALLLVANFREMGGLDPAKGILPTTPYWTLSLEEQFYIAFPALVILLPSRFGMVIGLCAAICFCLPDSGVLSYFRIDAILLGVLIAALERRAGWMALAPQGLASSRLGRAAILSVTIFLLSALCGIGWAIVPFRFGMIALLSAFLVWIASFDADFLMADGAIRRILAWIGSRSYGLYLVHITAFMTIDEIFFRLTGSIATPDAGAVTVRVLLGISLMFALSEATYRFLERPLRHRGKAIAAHIEKKYAAAIKSGSTL